MTFKPDIVMLDICMPFLDGISVLRQINQLSIKPKVIVISGYSEFEYAQNAMNFGASGYLLKPVGTDKLCEMLNKVMDEINEGRQIRHVSAEKMILERKNELFNLEKAVNSIIHTPERVIESRIWQNCSLPFMGDGKFQFAIFHIDHSSYNVWNKAFLGLDEIRQSAKSILSEAALKYEGLIFDNNKNVLELFAFIADSDSNKLLNKTKAFLIEAKQKVEEMLHISVTIAVSPVVDKLDHKLFEKLKMALDLRFISTNKKVFRSDEVDPVLLKGVSDEELKFLSYCIQKSDCEKIKTMLHEIFNKRILEEAAYVNVRLAYIEIVNLLSRTLSQLKIDVSEFLTENDISGEILDYFDQSVEIESYLYTTIMNAVIQEPKEALKSNNIIEEVVRHIDENYERSYTVKEIAYQFAINPNYFSMLFKKSKGQSFIEYVNSKKIEAACKLLASSPKLSVTEIADSLGFSDTQYFFKLFKKIMGKTPLEYKKSLIVVRDELPNPVL